MDTFTISTIKFETSVVKDSTVFRLNGKIKEGLTFKDVDLDDTKFGDGATAASVFVSLGV